MIRIGLIYLLPFMLIFILFGKQSVRYNQKTGLRTFIALLLFFGFQFISSFTVSFLILKYSSDENPKQTLVDNILLINILSSALGAITTFLYYRFTEKKLKINFSENDKEIDSLGEK
ncbi:hypothetical protein GCM10023210_08700 [Chryseobacterium ginsengisoli]|uniref:Uncharacterized protein n=1 Tax=Chryseobacterium ginsengisoli TaxID=363853 RepID=A0ABP9LW27_9FLAO